MFGGYALWQLAQDPTLLDRLGGAAGRNLAGELEERNMLAAGAGDPLTRIRAAVAANPTLLETLRQQMRARMIAANQPGAGGTPPPGSAPPPAPGTPPGTGTYGGYDAQALIRDPALLANLGEAARRRYTGAGGTLPANLAPAVQRPAQARQQRQRGGPTGTAGPPPPAAKPTEPTGGEPPPPAGGGEPPPPSGLSKGGATAAPAGSNELTTAPARRRRRALGRAYA